MQQRLEPRRVLSHVARAEQHAIGGAGRGCADDRVYGEIGGIGRLCEIAQRRVRKPLVVIVDPVRNLGPGMIEAEEQALVEKLVAHAPVETLAEAILHRLSWRNEMPDDPVVLRPGERGALAATFLR